MNDPADDPDWRETGGALLSVPLQLRFRRLDVESDQLIDMAGRRAAAEGSRYTATDDLLWAACRLSAARAALRRVAVDPDAVAARLPPGAGRPAIGPKRPPLTPALKEVVLTAEGLCASDGRASPAHLIVALCLQERSRAADVLRGAGAYPRWRRPQPPGARDATDAG